MRMITLLISSLLMISNAFADTSNLLDTKALAKAIANTHQRTGGDKGSFAIVYGGQDISRGNTGVMSTIDQTVLAG